MEILKKAKELQEGERIRMEYGNYGNYVNFHVDKATLTGGKMDVACHKDDIREEFFLNAEENVEIVEEGV